MQLKRIFQIRRGQNRLFEILQGHLWRTGGGVRCFGGGSAVRFERNMGKPEMKYSVNDNGKMW